MSENYTKSKEEIALELFKIIVEHKVQSGSNERTMLDKLTIEIPDHTARSNYCLSIFSECLAAVKDNKK